MALSGGVDSSLAAALLQEQGFEIIGITIKGWMPQGLTEEVNPKACCSQEAIDGARGVAQQLGFPFYVLNMQQQFFDTVVAPFVAGYLRGITPNPCLLCNRHIRFNLLYQKARELECHYVATGHYAQIKYYDGCFHLWRGIDSRKDQSYMLYSATQENLAMTLYPLGEMEKSQVRREAAQRGLRTATRSESQDICFVPQGDYASLVTELGVDIPPAGLIKHLDGTILGEHRGLHHYTIGQRRGLALTWREPLYVVAIEAQKNTLLVAEERFLWRDSLIANQISWINPVPEELEAEAKIRYGAKPAAAQLSRLPGGDAYLVHFQERQRAITPGQGVVFYRGEEVLGGGVISLS